MKKIALAFCFAFVLSFSLCFYFITHMLKAQAQEAKSAVVMVELKDLPVGSVMPLPEHKLVIFRDADGIYAISSVCTHMRCLLSFKKGSSTFFCSCHGSEFKSDGSVQRGPAQTSLSWFSVEADKAGVIKVDMSKTVPVGTKYKVEPQ